MRSRPSDLSAAKLHFQFCVYLNRPSPIERSSSELLALADNASPAAQRERCLLASSQRKGGSHGGGGGAAALVAALPPPPLPLTFFFNDRYSTSAGASKATRKLFKDDDGKPVSKP